MAIVELVVDQEALSVFVARIDVDHSESVVKSRLLDAFFVASFEPSGKNSKLTTGFEVFNKFLYRAYPDGE